MLRSMYSAVSGLAANQTRMDVIGNNIANVNTVGFKTSTAFIESAFDQSGRLPTTSRPVGISIGLGAQVSGTVKQFTQGAFQRTDVATDLAIQGDGFFVVNTAEDGTGTNYVTRAGNFIRDKDGYLRTQEGQYLMGDAAEARSDGTVGYPTTVLKVEMEVGGLEVVSFGFGKDGAINVTKADGSTEEVGVVTIQRFSSNNGLQHIGGNLYLPTDAASTDNTGSFYAGGYGGAGNIQSGALELSNVDLAKEFSDMIITQRGFDANAKTITTSDEMLQTITQLKR